MPVKRLRGAGTSGTSDEARKARAARQETLRDARREQNKAASTAALTGANNVAAQKNQSTAYLTGANNAAGINQADYSPYINWANANAAYQPVGGPGSGPGGAALAYANAIGNAFGFTPNPSVREPGTMGAGRAGRRTTGGVYPIPQVSKTVTERYQDWINSAANSALGYESYLFPTAGFQSTDNIPSGGGGGGGWYGGGGYGGGGGGGAGSSAYSAWLRGLLTRWQYG